MGIRLLSATKDWLHANNWQVLIEHPIAFIPDARKKNSTMEE